MFNSYVYIKLCYSTEYSYLVIATSALEYYISTTVSTYWNCLYYNGVSINFMTSTGKQLYKYGHRCCTELRLLCAKIESIYLHNYFLVQCVGKITFTIT